MRDYTEIDPREFAAADMAGYRPPVDLGDLSGPEGNVFVIIGRVRSALKRAGLREKAEEFTKRATSARSYDEVLVIVVEYCDVGTDD